MARRLDVSLVLRLPRAGNPAGTAERTGPAPRSEPGRHSGANRASPAEQNRARPAEQTGPPCGEPVRIESLAERNIVSTDPLPRKVFGRSGHSAMTQGMSRALPGIERASMAR